MGRVGVADPDDSSDLRYFVGPAAYPQLQHAAPEGVGMEVEESGGSPRSFYHSAAPFERRENVAALDLFERREP